MSLQSLMLVLALLLLLVLPANASEAPQLPPRIQPEELTVVAVMMENRAFDHVLGHLGRTDPRINGLRGDERCPIDPADPSKGSLRVSFNAPDVLGINRKFLLKIRESSVLFCFVFFFFCVRLDSSETSLKFFRFVFFANDQRHRGFVRVSAFSNIVFDILYNSFYINLAGHSVGQTEIELWGSHKFQDPAPM